MPVTHPLSALSCSSAASSSSTASRSFCTHKHTRQNALRHRVGDVAVLEVDAAPPTTPDLVRQLHDRLALLVNDASLPPRPLLELLFPRRHGRSVLLTASQPVASLLQSDGRARAPCGHVHRQRPPVRDATPRFDAPPIPPSTHLLQPAGGAFQLGSHGSQRRALGADGRLTLLKAAQAAELLLSDWRLRRWLCCFARLAGSRLLGLGMGSGGSRGSKERADKRLGGCTTTALTTVGRSILRAAADRGQKAQRDW